MSNYNILKNKVLFKKYKVNKMIGKGSFGCVFQGTNILDNSDIAIKVESKNAKCHLLEQESNFLSILKGYGIPEIKSYGRSGKFYILVQELLGKNIAQIKKSIKILSLTDIAMLAIQIIDRIEYIHSKYIIHRDIKPENFTVGLNNNSIIYIIDFGISRKYKSSRTGKHLKFSLTGKMFGTVRYVSYNGSRGVEQSRRDDLESIGYMLVYLAKGILPWQTLKMNAQNIKKKYLEMLYLKKFLTPEKICEGLPKEFSEYLKYCRNLAFEQDPNYEYLRSLFKNILMERNQIKDIKFSWVENNNFSPIKNSKKILNLKNNKDKYINLLKRKQSPQTRLYRAIQHSLEKDEKSFQARAEEKSELSCEQKDIFSNKKININIHNRGVSEDAIKRNNINVLDNSNISRETIAYNSLMAQYNMNVNGFQDENKIYELFHLRRRNRITKSSPDNYINSNSLINIKNNYNYDYKSTDYSTKSNVRNSFNSLLNEKNKKKQKQNIKQIKKKLNFSINLDKNYIKDSNIYENDNHSYNQQIKNKLNKQIKIPEDKRRIYCKNIYMNIIKKIEKQIKLARNKNQDSIDRQIEILSDDIEKYRNNEINQNLINKFNLNEDSFSFKNSFACININPRIFTNKNIENKINKEINNNKLNNDNYNNNIIFKKLNANNEIKKAMINNDKVNLRMNKNLEKKNIRDDGRINIIINNNVNSLNRNSPNKININNKTRNNKINNYRNKYNIVIQNKNNIINNNDEIIENDYKSYHYINKIPKSNNINQNIKQFNSKQNYFYQYNNNNNKQFENNTNYNILNNNLNKDTKPNNIQKQRFEISEKKPVYIDIEQPNIINYKNINNLISFKRLNTYNNSNSNSFIEKENSFLIGKMRVFKINNNSKNPYKIRTQKYNGNNLIINNSNIKNNIININNNLHRNNFSNDIELYNHNNKIYFLNKKKLIFTRKNVHQNLSPSPINYKNNDTSRNIFEVKSFDGNKRKIVYRSTSNKKKNILNYNSDYLEELESFHIPKNINKCNTRGNKLIRPKCFNN